MLTDAIIHFKERLRNSLPKILDPYKAAIAREAIILLDKAEKLTHQDDGRKEIEYLVTRALILGDNAGIFNERFNEIQTQIQRRGDKAFKTGEKN